MVLTYVFFLRRRRENIKCSFLCLELTAVKIAKVGPATPKMHARVVLYSSVAIRLTLCLLLVVTVLVRGQYEEKQALYNSQSSLL